MKILIVLIVCSLVLGQRNFYSEYPGGVLFPGPISPPNRQAHLRSSPTTNEITLSESLALARRLNELSSFDDILEIVDGLPSEEKELLLNSRFGDVERTSAVKPTPALCLPELQTVSLKNDTVDPSTVYMPSCTRINRCGGCCSHPLLACEPLTWETRNFLVMVTKVEGRNSLHYRSKEIVPLEEHTSCKCNCRIKPEHCTERQVYVKEACICKCLNSDEEAKCKQNNETKLWDPDGCACLCRIIEDCNTGWEFDENTCSCRRSSSIERYFGRGTNYKHGIKNGDVPPVIITLDASDPRRKHKDEPN